MNGYILINGLHLQQKLIDGNLSEFDDVFNDNTCHTLLISFASSEPNDDKWMIKFQDFIRQAKLANKKISIVNEMFFYKHKDALENCDVDDIIWIDWMRTNVYVRVVQKKESSIPDAWTPNTDKFLFLTGKPDRTNRIGWIYKFYQENLLEHCEWSLHVPENLRSTCRSFLPISDDKQAYQWIDQFIRNPDQISVVPTGSNIHYCGIPFGDIYKSASFQVISESFEKNADPWITEKTWLAIINRRPFILASYPGHGCYRWLQEQGFLTFDEFLLDTKFDTDIDDESRWQSLTGNIRHWLDTLPKNADKIAEIVEHNYQQLVKLATQDLAALDQFFHRHNIEDESEREKLVYFYDFHQHAQWSAWYSRIRDASWPDCEREQDFIHLPGWIQKECIEVFGYRPKSTS